MKIKSLKEADKLFKAMNQSAKKEANYEEVYLRCLNRDLDSLLKYYNRNVS